jgi:hypothetical protein
MLAFAVGCGVALGSVASVRAASGEELFAKYCLCHGKDGSPEPAETRRQVYPEQGYRCGNQQVLRRKDERGGLKTGLQDKLTPEIKSLIAVAKFSEMIRSLPRGQVTAGR